MPSLKTVLERVSKNCLRGQPVPDDLRLLWQAKLNEEADLLDDVEMELVDELDDEFFEGYREDSGAPAYSVRSYKRMFEQIAFVAKTMDGGLLGYWLGESGRPVKDAPVVEVDSEGQFELKGTSVAEYLLLFGDEDEFDERKTWLNERGITVDVGNQEEIWTKLKGFEDPNQQSSRYQKEEQAKGE